MSLFDQVYDRKKTDSLKWDKLKAVYGRDNVDGIIPMWVADMDFAAPSCIKEAIQTRLNNPIYGYSFEGEACQQAIIQWMATHHQTTIEAPWIMYHQGVVPAIATVVETFTAPGDSVLMMAPTYPPFFNAPKTLDREAVFYPLIEKERQYTIDFDDFETYVARDEVKLFILCHPHNPIGFTWTEAELQKLDALCAKHDVLLVSDEIHSDLVLNGKHVPTLNVTQHRDNVITLFAPTKTFNIAGIHAAMMFVSEPAKRKAIQHTMQRQAQGGLNIFASAAITGAFSEAGAEWLETLKDYLRENIRITAEALNAVDGLHIEQNDATYLMWLDYRETNFEEKEIMNRLLDEGVALDPGKKFGPAGDGFLRINIACPRETLNEGIARITRAFAR
ncbi:MalY/PatB family protein [Kurthia massiliensis]|uniref:MalY/PatB family protein n=1 Tax=Kurthia massiliensis TaxID=1033739 RepID=UPI000288589A|nr:MalY/PatB family protein [Kurthia massiliensis]